MNANQPPSSLRLGSKGSKPLTLAVGTRCCRLLETASKAMSAGEGSEPGNVYFIFTGTLLTLTPAPAIIHTYMACKSGGVVGCVLMSWWSINTLLTIKLVGKAHTADE